MNSIKLADGLYLNAVGRFTCTMCKKTGIGPLLSTSLSPQFEYPIKFEIDKYNKNLKHWDSIFELIHLHRGTPNLFRNHRTFQSLCSIKCLNKYIKPYKAEIVLALAKEDSA